MTNVIYPPEFQYPLLELRELETPIDPLPCDSEWRPDDPSQPARGLKEVK